MRSRWLSFNLAAAAIALIAHLSLAQARLSSTNDQSQTGSFFSQQESHEPIISLDGMWHYHPGDVPAWASPSFDDSAWPLLRSDQSWTAQGYQDKNGFAWYRFSAQVPSTQSPRSLALLLPAILTDYEVFANGMKVGGFGQMPPHGSLRFNQPLLYRLPHVAPGATIQFAIRVWHHPIFATYLGGGPRYAGARMGDASLLEQRLRLLEADRLMGVVSFYAIGILNAVISITVFGLFSTADPSASTYGSRSSCSRTLCNRLSQSPTSSFGSRSVFTNSYPRSLALLASQPLSSSSRACSTQRRR